MITFETGSLANAKRLLKKVRVCSLAESLGGVETLISHPATMTHAALGPKGRKTIGITDGMVRISVGIEDVEDIIRDLETALKSDLISAPRHSYEPEAACGVAHLPCKLVCVPNCLTSPLTSARLNLASLGSLFNASESPVPSCSVPVQPSISGGGRRHGARIAPDRQAHCDLGG